VNCRDLAALCSGYVDGELDDRRASAVRGHARVCQACRELLADEEQVRDAAAELPVMDPPAELWAGIEARIAAEEIGDSERPRWWFWWHSLREHALPAAVGAVAVVAVGVWLWQRSPPSNDALAPAIELAQTPVPGAAADPELGLDFEAARRAELERADARYRTVLADLRVIAAEMDDELDLESAELRALGAARQRALAAAPGLDVSTDPVERDAVYDAYQAEIAATRMLAFARVTR
jgi:hypothetical protein